MENKKFNSVQEIFDLYVPSRGAAENLGGEIARAYMAIEYAAWNDGDLLCYDKDKLCKTYIKETASWLQKLGDSDIYHEIAKLRRIKNYKEYSAELKELEQMILNYVNSNPDVFEITDFDESR